MTPPRIPPPSDDDIPRPVAGPDSHPVEMELDGVRYDDEVEVVEDFAGEGPKTQLTRRCIGCAGEFVELDDDAQPPTSHAEAWGRYGGKCRGTRDASNWSWCKGPIGEGRMQMPRQGLEVFFRDRRQGGGT